MSTDNISSKDKKINILLDNSFSKLGLNQASIGTKYFKEMIKLVYINNIFDIKYKDLCNNLSIKFKSDIQKIDRNIYSSINSININLAQKNFKNIFNIEFDYFYLSPKKLIVLFVNLLNNNI